MRIFIVLLIVVVSLIRAEAQTCAAFVGGYIPSWRDPNAVDYTKLTHVFYAFASSSGNGNLVVDAPAVFETFKAASTGKQRFISIGGAGDATLKAMATSSSTRQAFVANCVSFCQTHSLQGIDVDWEAITTAGDSVLYSAFMRELAGALHSQGLQLSATIGYGSYGGDFYNVGALKNADWIQLMVYDQTGTWAESPFGNHSTFQQVLDAIHYWTNRGYSDLTKVVIGIPFYGYRFSSSSGGLAQGVTYSEIVNAHPGMPCDWDEVDLTVFNSPELIRKKVRYVIDHALKGVMIWEMGQDLPSNDKKSLLKAVSLAVCDLPAACDFFITTGVPDSPSGISVSPNPAKESITIHVDSSEPGRIELTNCLGQRIFEREAFFVDGQEIISVSDISPGTYFVRITTADHGLVIKRIVKLN